MKILRGGSSEDPKDMVKVIPEGMFKVLPESLVGVLPEG